MEIFCTPVLSKQQNEAPRLIGIDDNYPDKTTLIFEDGKEGSSEFKLSFKRLSMVIARCHGFTFSKEKIMDIFPFFSCKYEDFHLCEILRKEKSSKETLRFANCKLILEMDIESDGEVVLTESGKNYSGRSLSEVLKFRQNSFMSRC